ncbi:hypothetical protein J6590_043702 [Homalodisca vitripennis]|nr:hypothetical protein J6590_043702 [Homalodisca vitripennis]
MRGIFSLRGIQQSKRFQSVKLSCQLLNISATCKSPDFWKVLAIEQQFPLDDSSLQNSQNPVASSHEGYLPSEYSYLLKPSTSGSF